MSHPPRLVLPLALSALVLSSLLAPASRAAEPAPKKPAAPGESQPAAPATAPAAPKPVAAPSSSKATPQEPAPGTPTPAVPGTPGTPAPAAPPSPVYCGTFTCFLIRVPLGGETPDLRASRAMDVINKYLGGAVGKVTTEVRGKSIRLLLNGDLVAVVSPADAAVEKQKSVALAAAKWAKQLSQAFEASKARR